MNDVGVLVLLILTNKLLLRSVRFSRMDYAKEKLGISKSSYNILKSDNMTYGRFIYSCVLSNAVIRFGYILYKQY